MKLRCPGVVAATLGATLVGVVAPTAVASGSGAVLDTAGERVIVFFDEARTPTSILNALTDETTLTLSRSISDGIAVYRTSGGLSAAGLNRVEEDISALGTVTDVVRDERVTPGILSLTDPRYSTDQHALYGEYGINVEPAWALTLGEGVNVAVIDTGVVKDHPEFTGQLVGGYDFIAADSPGDFTTANDGDGWDADASDPGDRCNYSDPTSRSSWHGTHVTGTIVAAQNNGLGGTGAAPGSKVVPIRALGRCGGYLSDLIPAMKWAAGMTVSSAPANPNPARIINMSLGSPVACTGGLKTVVDDVIAAGALIVAAAGNSDGNVLGDTTVTPTKPTSYPANCANALTVAAVDDNGTRAWFSNYGSLVDVAAPGVGIFSTFNTGATGPDASTYKFLNGTSMAAPHVAATAALVLSVNPTISTADLATLLKTKVTALPPFPGTEPQPGDDAYPPCDLPDVCGTGIVDAGSAVVFASENVRPNAPTAVSAARSGRDVTVSWTASSSAGSSAIARYVVRNGGADVCTTPDGTTTSCTIPAMALGTYTFTVHAENDSGRGPASSASNSVTVVAPPSAVTGVSAARTAQSVTVSWSAPLETGGLSVEYVVSGGPSGDVVTSSTSYQFTSLTAGTTYTFGVTARNSEGSASVVSATPVTVYSSPSAARSVGTSRTGRDVTVSWSAPSESGGLSVEYVVSGGPSGDVVTSSTSYQFTSLTIGTTYTFGVTARNTEGSASVVSASPVTVYTAPSSARSVGTSRTGRDVTVSWSAPSETGGLSVEYVVSGGPSGDVVTSSTSYQFTSLTAGTTYTFGVTARNSEGSASVASAPPVTVYSAPSVARNVAVTLGQLSVTVTWRAPSQTGGLPVEYVVSGGPDGNVTTSLTSLTFSGLSYGVSYAFSVTARNSEGTASAVSAPTVTFTEPTTTTSPTTTTIPPVTTSTSSSTTTSTTSTSTTTTTTTTVPLTTTTGLGAPINVRTVKRSSKTPLRRIYVPPSGSRARWSWRGSCSIKSPYLLASRTRGTCVLTIRVTLKGRTTTRVLSIRVL